MKYKSIYLKRGKEVPIHRQHPWIFSGAIHSMEENPVTGEVVEVFDSNKKYLATGHYQEESIIVKILTFDRQNIDKTFWVEKIKKALTLRELIGFMENPDTNVFRLVNSEGDFLPGLILDHYNGHIVLQAHSYGIYLSRNTICQALEEIFGDKLLSVYTKSRETLKKSRHKIVDEYLFGKSTQTYCTENGHKFSIDWESGQKTGFFIDQRENRQLLSRYAKGKSVLNAYCYSGGFSVYALASGAASVDSVDISKTAIELTEKNIVLNQFEESKHMAMIADIHEYIAHPEKNYDLIILDPPAFAKHAEARHRAVKGYKHINKAALESISPNGILFTFSCSHVVDEKLFTGIVMAAAIEAGRNVRILHRLTQAPDHPVNIFHPEGGYLKGLVLFVE